MKTIAFSVEGPIRGKGRGRAFVQNGRIIVTTPPETRRSESIVAWHAKQAMGSQAPLKGPINLDIVIWVAPPQRWTKTQKRAALGMGAPNRATGKPDWDNAGKLISDALNGIVYEDDSQISDAHVRRRYRDQYGADILVTEAEGEWVQRRGCKKVAA